MLLARGTASTCRWRQPVCVDIKCVGVDTAAEHPHTGVSTGCNRIGRMALAAGGRTSTADNDRDRSIVDAVAHRVACHALSMRSVGARNARQMVDSQSSRLARFHRISNEHSLGERRLGSVGLTASPSSAGFRSQRASLSVGRATFGGVAMCSSATRIARGGGVPRLVDTVLQSASPSE